MADHNRILGGLFIAWGLIQGFGAVALVAFSQEPVRWPGLLLFLGVILLAAYATVGWKMWQRDTRTRVPAIALSAIALLSFPVGTALGIYGLIVTLRRPLAIERPA